MRFATAHGAALRDLRRQRQLTLKGVADQLAEKLGRPINKATLSRIENNKLEPGDELFDALCELLKGDRDQLRSIEVPPELADHVRKLTTANGAT